MSSAGVMIGTLMVKPLVKINKNIQCKIVNMLFVSTHMGLDKHNF